jgi:hypothetical protein
MHSLEYAGSKAMLSPNLTVKYKYLLVQHDFVWRRKNTFSSSYQSYIVELREELQLVLHGSGNGVIVGITK